MSQAGWVIVWVAVGVAVVFAGVWFGRQWWLKRARAALVVLMARAESIRSALESLQGFMGRLVKADAEAWAAFASDAQDDERKALAEVCHRMDVVSHELMKGPLQKAAHPVADIFQEIAENVRDWTAEVGEAETPEKVLDVITRTVDLRHLVESFNEAYKELEHLMEVFGVKDPSVYGGGLYI